MEPAFTIVDIGTASMEAFLWLFVAVYLASLARILYRRASVMTLTLPGVLLLVIFFLVLFG